MVFLGRNVYQNIILESQIYIYKRVYEGGAKPLYISLKVFTLDVARSNTNFFHKFTYFGIY